MDVRAPAGDAGYNEARLPEAASVEKPNADVSPGRAGPRRKQEDEDFMTVKLKGRHFLKLEDFSRDEIVHLLDLAVPRNITLSTEPTVGGSVGGSIRNYARSWGLQERKNRVAVRVGVAGARLELATHGL